MLQYVTVFDPSQSKNEDDLHKQLLLYHSFEDLEVSLNDKLGRIGMIQGIWSLTDSLSDVQSSEEKIIELSRELILVIKVESRFFISLCISVEDENESSQIPHQLYLSHMWYCYQFFALQNGYFSKFTDARELTDLLNEHVVSFWQDILLKPEAIIRRGLAGLWPDSCKMAELEFEHSEESWESLITQNILLETESYLGIKDVLVYHLPNFNETKDQTKNLRLGYKTYGLVRHFSNDIGIIPQLSNWIYHMHAVYGELSSHVLAGNAHYKEAPQQNDNTMDGPEEGSNGASTNQETLQEQGKVLLHNLTLPISFAYDAVHEVGATTGISNSISLLMDYVPKWGTLGGQNERTNHEQLSKRSRYGYLISPLSSKMLPMSYKVKKIVREQEDGESKNYNLLFWYYDDILAVIVCEPTFTKIWESQYLEDLSYKLCKGIAQFYKTAFQRTDVKRPQKREPFAYTTYSKISKELRSSIPTWFDAKTESDDVSPLRLVINGVDQLFGGGANSSEDAGPPVSNNWGIDIMGGLFGINRDKINTTSASMREYRLDKKYDNFLDGLTQMKTWELQSQIIQFLMSLKSSAKAADITEERLLKLNNGLLCYIRDDENEIAIVIKNWFENEDELSSKSLLLNLSKDPLQIS
ncbi:Ccz1p TDEL_0C05330 [Torulaspora delbrueckii]|uniref:CCZ1/INTU/HSP4 first Longin domain-containing protein n=1 Tax=Torulaspora delbrueckii TaxID=4950 RepID=G8ZSD0_TORDE|nr:hypothetical protein TDEL_0C05330 [Torulaspora delbrueckii]CCE91422.1 hypothetical protein TDEL_0C05330 [Torulaspora delbrueckii]